VGIGSCALYSTFSKRSPYNSRVADPLRPVQRVGTANVSSLAVFPLTPSRSYRPEISTGIIRGIIRDNSGTDGTFPIFPGYAAKTKPSCLGNSGTDGTFPIFLAGRFRAG